MATTTETTYSTGELAQYLRVSATTIKELARARKLRHTWENGRRRYQDAEVKQDLGLATLSSYQAMAA